MKTANISLNVQAVQSRGMDKSASVKDKSFENFFSKKIKRLKEINLEKLQQYRRHVDTEIPSSNINKKNVLVEPTDRLPHLSCNLGKSLNSNSE